jgi:hypothetical protein
MKKLAIGCLVVFVILCAGAVTAGYYLYFKVRSVATQVAEFRQIPQIEAGIRVKTPFTPPTTGELTSAQLERFMKVQATVKDRLGKNLEALQRNYKSLSDKKDANVTDLPQILSAYRDLAASWMDAKRAQVQALNDAGLSLEEYRWIRDETYQALGVPFVSMDFARIAEQVKAGQTTGEAVLGGGVSGPIPPANAKLVEPFRKQLSDALPLAAFGL